MDITALKTQIVMALAALVILWIFFKVLKLIWKITVVFLIFVGLSFALPTMREWIFGFFR